MNILKLLFVFFLIISTNSFGSSASPSPSGSTSSLQSGSVSSSLSSSSDTEVAIHPKPKDPIYLNASIYENLKRAIPPAPVKGSKAQKNDEKIILNYQSKRTELDCKKANNEILINLVQFFGKPNGPLDEKELARMDGFFNKIRNDADFFIQKLKIDYPRQRPYLYLSQATPCLKREMTQAYPSGHAALSKLYADILSELYPNYKDQLSLRAKEIGKNRVLGGVHHPSDIEAGRKLADLLLIEFKKSKAFNEELKAQVK